MGLQHAVVGVLDQCALHSRSCSSVDEPTDVHHSQAEFGIAIDAECRREEERNEKILCISSNRHLAGVDDRNGAGASADVEKDPV